MKLKNVKSGSGRMKCFIYPFCDKIPEIMGCVASLQKVKNFKECSTSCFEAQANLC